MSSLLASLSLPPIPSAPARRSDLVWVEADPQEPMLRIPTTSRVRPMATLLHRGIPGATRDLWVRKSVLDRLLVAASLLPEGFCLIVHDAWRSTVAQRALSEEANRLAAELGLDGETFAFNPDNPSGSLGYPTDDPPHRTGGAVDVMLGTADGHEWPMAVPFDGISALTSTAALEARPDADPHALLGRRLLYSVLTRAGFTNYPAEFWHYDFGNAFWRHFGSLGAGPMYRSIEDSPEP